MLVYIVRLMIKLILSFLLIGIYACPGSAIAAHACSLYSTPKYPPDFKHFEYVNPDAPKGGTLFLANPDRRTSFDKFNPFSLKGVAAAGVSSLMFETLTTTSAPWPLVISFTRALKFSFSTSIVWCAPSFRATSKRRASIVSPLTLIH